MNRYTLNVKQEIKIQNEREGSKKKKKCIFFRICLNGNDYHFKTSRSSNRSVYANSMVSTNQNSTLDTQKLERKEHKYTTKNSSNHKGNNKMKGKKKKVNRDEVQKQQENK